ncbi:MAG TPA: aminotransferase class III-fold pyridoxal phosphate-dependent enzyme [Polyangiaceae bacterium]|nr:aminotransferase class III-fold pyridoxal phosphate-dependent enzyme [Polyangiaceae bacterium]
MAGAGRYEQSTRLLERARAVIPGGHHLSGRPLLVGEESPLYMTRGKGARCWDADGNEYIDYIGAYGPFLLGYAHEEVDAAARAQLERGSLLSLNHPLHVEFAERLVARFPSAQMATFFKTGSEATTAALRIARVATGRRSVVRCGYHGWHDWCLPLEPFVPVGLEQQVHELDVSRPASLEKLFQNHAGTIAAVIVAPEMISPPQPDVFRQLMAITRAHGALFILDEVKTALRIKPGSFQEYIGLVPDLTALSKALGNGWPIAAVLGKREVMQVAAGMHLSATYHGDTAAMAAAMATLDFVQQHPVAEHVWAMGERLIAGLNESAARHGIVALAFGEPLPPMPFLKFLYSDPACNDRVMARFYREVLAQGVLLHPRHLWFVSYAHSAGDIERTLSVADAAFRAARAEVNGP